MSSILMHAGVDKPAPSDPLPKPPPDAPKPYPGSDGDTDQGGCE